MKTSPLEQASSKGYWSSSLVCVTRSVGTSYSKVKFDLEGCPIKPNPLGLMEHEVHSKYCTPTIGSYSRNGFLKKWLPFS